MSANNRICYVVGAMSLSMNLRPYPAPGDYVIAADRGFDSLMAFGVTPDLVVGVWVGYDDNKKLKSNPMASKYLTPKGKEIKEAAAEYAKAHPAGSGKRKRYDSLS